MSNCEKNCGAAAFKEKLVLACKSIRRKCSKPSKTHSRCLSEGRGKSSPLGLYSPGGLTVKATPFKSSRNLKMRKQTNCQLPASTKQKRTSGGQRQILAPVDLSNEYMLGIKPQQNRKMSKRDNTHHKPSFTKKIYAADQRDYRSNSQDLKLRATVSEDYLQQIDWLLEVQDKKDILREKELSEVAGRQATRLQRLHDIERAQTLLQIQQLKMKFNLSERQTWLQ